MVSYQRYAPPMLSTKEGEPSTLTSSTISPSRTPSIRLGIRLSSFLFAVWGGIRFLTGSSQSGNQSLQRICAGSDCVGPDRLSLTVGAKLEHDYYTGFAAMPSARIAWTPSTRSTYWAAVLARNACSRDMDAGMRMVSTIFPDSDGNPSSLFSWVIPISRTKACSPMKPGIAVLLRKNLSVDLAAYYNSYDHAT